MIAVPLATAAAIVCAHNANNHGNYAQKRFTAQPTSRRTNTARCKSVMAIIADSGTQNATDAKALPLPAFSQVFVRLSAVRGASQMCIARVSTCA